MDGSDGAAGAMRPPMAAELARVVAWFSDERTRKMLAVNGITTTWNVHADTDGSVLLLPMTGPEPGFALIPTGDDIEVLVGDTERELELGPFPSLEEALHGIARWLASDTETRH
jgi:hypothetical protein